MSWFEATSIASFAKSAIKEAQKTIDKALDINEEDNAVTGNVKTEKLKKDSENFFSGFGLTDLVDQSSSKKISKDVLGDNSMVNSIWGSFSGSFFENQSETSEKAQSASVPVTPSSPVVAKQPPRNVSDLSTSNEKLNSSNTSSILQLESSDTLSSNANSVSGYPLPDLSNLLSTSAIPIECDDGNEDTWMDKSDWNWDSSCELKSSVEDDVSNKESNAEDSLTDEGVEAFSTARLIVGSVEESENIISTILADEKSPYKVSSTTAPDDATSSSVPLSLDLTGLIEAGAESKVETESPDSSIVALGSGALSPSTPSLSYSNSDHNESYLFSHRLEVRSDVIPSISSPLSPSSIEILSEKSSEGSSPGDLDVSSSVSDSCNDNLSSVGKESLKTVISECQDSHIKYHLESNSSIPLQSEDTFESHSVDSDKTTVEKELSEAITNQPVSSTSNFILEESVPRCDSVIDSDVDGLDGKSGDGLKSMVGSTASSSTLTLVESTGHLSDTYDNFGSPSKNPPLSPIIDDAILVQYEDGSSESNVHSMNAGEIRKKLDKVDKDGLTPEWKSSVLISFSKDTDSESLLDLDTTKVSEGPSTSLCSEKSLEMSSASSVTTLEASCRSESSSETVTASDDFQQMNWNDLTLIDQGADDIQELNKDIELTECVESDETKESLEHNISDNIDEVEQFESLPEQGAPSASSSDSMKICSSEHSSADEMETTNSSDIEIISSPSIDGSVGGNGKSAVTAVSSMASKAWLSAQKNLRSFIHERPDASSSSTGSVSKRDSLNGGQGETVPSSMTTSFTSASESEADNSHMISSENMEVSRLSSALLLDLYAKGKGHKRSKSSYSETSEMSFVDNLTPETDLFRKLNQLNEILEARESKVFELSQANASLVEVNAALKIRLKEMECPNENTEGLREEFTQRLVNMERKFQQALKEKELMKKQIEEFIAEASSKGSDVSLRRELEERDTIIHELRSEGEALSKQQLNYSTHIKKLRSKDKENEATISSQSKKIESQKSELDRLQKQLKAKEEVEGNQINAIRQLTLMNSKREEDTSLLRAENTELEGKLTSLKEALETAYREMREFQERMASKESELKQMALSADLSSQQKLGEVLKDAKIQYKRENEALLSHVKELQDTCSRSEQQSNRRERYLKEEVQDLQRRLSESEARVEQLSSSVSAATRPLLRQLDNLQSSQEAQRISWESVEESLTRRLQEAQNAAAASARKEREAKDHASSLVTQVSSIQNEVASLQLANDQLKLELGKMTSKLTATEAEKSKETNRVKALKESFAEEINELKRERDILDQKLEMERTVIAAEKRKSATCQEQIKEKDRKITQLQNLLTATQHGESRPSSLRSSPTPSLSRISNAGSVFESLGGSHWGDDVFDGTGGSIHRGVNSLYEVVRGNQASTLEALTAALRSKEGEVYHLQSELTRLEAKKESLAQALVKASCDQEEKEALSEELKHSKKSSEDLEQKYNALLQMYGEKVEEVDELRLDLADVKEMYKLQIDQLMQK